MGLNDLTPEKLAKIQDVLVLFSFYGITEEDVKHLPELFADVKRLKEEVASFRTSQENAKRNVEARKMPSSEELHQIFRANEELKDE